jgi:hypothetical protein
MERTGTDRIRQEASGPRTDASRSLALTLLDVNGASSCGTEIPIGKYLIGQKSSTPPVFAKDT